MKLLLLICLTSVTIFWPNLYFLFCLFLLLIIFSPKSKLFSWLKPLIFISLIILLFGNWQSVLKITTLSLLVFYYTATTSVSQIVKTFSFLPQSWQLMLTITLSLIPVIFAEAQKIKLIQISRGYRNKNPLPLIIPLLHRTLSRAEQLALVIETRNN